MSTRTWRRKKATHAPANRRLLAQGTWIIHAGSGEGRNEWTLRVLGTVGCKSEFCSGEGVEVLTLGLGGWVVLGDFCFWESFAVRSLKTRCDAPNAFIRFGVCSFDGVDICQKSNQA